MLSAKPLDTSRLYYTSLVPLETMVNNIIQVLRLALNCGKAESCIQDGKWDKVSPKDFDAFITSGYIPDSIIVRRAGTANWLNSVVDTKPYRVVVLPRSVNSKSKPIFVLRRIG